MINRIIKRLVDEKLKIAPAVIVNGPRRAGKTTFVQSYEKQDNTFISLDKDQHFQSAKKDPDGFIRSSSGNLVIIDEIQRLPELFRSIKLSITEDNSPGRFLLTGSLKVRENLEIVNSFATRFQIVELLPLSQIEIYGNAPTLLDRLFDGELPDGNNTLVGKELIQLVLRGGFPEPVQYELERNRLDWAGSYVKSQLTLIIAESSESDFDSAMRRVFPLLASYSGNLLNLTEISKRIGVKRNIVEQCIAALENRYLIKTVNHYHPQPSYQMMSMQKENVKLHFLDSCILAHTLGISELALIRDRDRFGPVLESFVFAEISKQASVKGSQMRVFHYHDKNDNEVDIVLARNDGTIVGIEVKAKSSVNSSDFKGIKSLANKYEDRFSFGVVLYDGSKNMNFGEKLAAIPISSLWA